MRLEGQELVTGPDGTVQGTTLNFNEVQLNLELESREVRIDERTRARFARYYGKNTVLRLAFDIDYLTDFSFKSILGADIPPAGLDSMKLKSSIGDVTEVRPGEDAWLFGTRVVPDSTGLQVKNLYYTVERITVGGANVVNNNQQRFEPVNTPHFGVDLLFYRVQVKTRDAFFGQPIGRTLEVRYPNGRIDRHHIPGNGKVALPSLPRGDYHMVVVGPNLGLSGPVSVSRNQVVDLKVFSYVDLATVSALGLGLIGGLLVAGIKLRRRHRSIERQPGPVVSRPGERTAVPAFASVREYDAPPARTSGRDTDQRGQEDSGHPWLSGRGRVIRRTAACVAAFVLPVVLVQIGAARNRAPDSKRPAPVIGTSTIVDGRPARR